MNSQKNKKAAILMRKVLVDIVRLIIDAFALLKYLYKIKFVRIFVHVLIIWFIYNYTGKNKEFLQFVQIFIDIYQINK